MLQARAIHTATLLLNGKVLVTGGQDGSGLATAEVYDPSINGWAPAATMSTIRYWHRVTLLTDGEVLVTSGRDNGSFLNTAEVYDPGANTFSSTVNMAYAHHASTATRLQDGRVLVAGGWNGSAISHAEIYDPSDHMWHLAPDMNDAHFTGAATHDIWLSAIIGGLVILMLVLFYKELLIASFDRVAAEAMGLPVFLLDLLLLVLISLTIVVSLRAVGNILVVAMLVTPAATARLLTERLQVMMGLSAAIGVISGVAGLFISYHSDVAAGGTIVLVATAIFGVVWLLSPGHGYLTTQVLRRRLKQTSAAEARVLFESPEIRRPGVHQQ